MKEAERAIGQLRLAAVAVATQGMKEHLGSRTFWPIYETLDRLGAPLCVHNRREGPTGDHRFDSFLYMHTIGRPVETAIQFAGLMRDLTGSYTLPLTLAGLLLLPAALSAFSIREKQYSTRERNRLTSTRAGETTAVPSPNSSP